MKKWFWEYLPCTFLLILGWSACQKAQVESNASIRVLDTNLTLELIARDPDIRTPIGLAIDAGDHLFVLESHTHSPESDYDGPDFDRIKKGIDTDRDGQPDRWTVFADSLEDGMNLAAAPDGWIYVTTKNSVVAFLDQNNDGISDQKRTLLRMIKPDYIYDHSGILGVALGPEDWVYVSRGNTGSQHWIVEGTDGRRIEGYGDGGSVFRCKTDGSRVEPIATGFWNPFDLKFTATGRLLLTDNDPDSRGPNRLIELVPGGDYGYRSLFGGSGLHPYVAWNGELPGTLPYAAPLGEAPCALVDASYTNFGESYQGHILVNIWEENNIVRVPLQSTQEGRLQGAPQILVQGDSLFHPVSLATNSRGELYITDWVIRQYPNHGSGKIWRLRAKEPQSSPAPAQFTARRFSAGERSFPDLLEILSVGDEFQRAAARHQLQREQFRTEVLELLRAAHPPIRLEGLLTALRTPYVIPAEQLSLLILDENPNVQKTALIYTGSHQRTEQLPTLRQALLSGRIDSYLFETYLATIELLQPEFVAAFSKKTHNASNKLPRQLPDRYIDDIIRDKAIPELTRAIALPYLQQLHEKENLLLALLAEATHPAFRENLLRALRRTVSPGVEAAFLQIAANATQPDRLRTQAILGLTYQAGNHCSAILPLLVSKDPALQQAVINYLCRCSEETPFVTKVNDLLAASQLPPAIQASWQRCTGQAVDRPETVADWQQVVNDQGSAARGHIVFEAQQSQCLNCHQVNGWGGQYGPALSKVGSSKSRSLLVRAILEPSAEIAPEWQGWYVVDQDGGKHYGRQIDVHLHHAELMNEDGTFTAYENPQDFGVMQGSLMPAGLQNTMTPHEFNDLIAYLESLQ